MIPAARQAIVMNEVSVQCDKMSVNEECNEQEAEVRRLQVYIFYLFKMCSAFSRFFSLFFRWDVFRRNFCPHIFWFHDMFITRDLFVFEKKKPFYLQLKILNIRGDICMCALF